MKNLNEKQIKFLEVLFVSEEEGGAGGDFIKAKVLAGYHPTYSTRTLLASLKEHIEQATRDYFVQVGPKAAMKIVKVLDEPTMLGAKESLAASKELLDRAGIVKIDKVDVTSNGGLFILPPKQAEEKDE